MATRQDFVTRTQQLAQGSPYAVTPTPQGCDVTLDLADATFYTAMAREGLSKTFTFHVALDEASQSLTITDDSQEIEWQAGVDGAEQRPVVRGNAQRSTGRVYEMGAQKVFAWGEDGSYGPQVDYAFSSGEGRALLRRVAQEQGWSEKMGGQQRIGLYVALGVVGLIVVIGVVALILALA